MSRDLAGNTEEEEEIKQQQDAWGMKTFWGRIAK